MTGPSGQTERNGIVGVTRRIVRDGETVRRPAGYWTPAVHLLLNHLERIGFEYAPRVIGMDGEFEILSFVPGETAAASDDEVLASVGRLLRRYHDAVASFDPPPGAQWQQTSIPTVGTLVCHNDLYPGNVVFHGREAVGLIDFDFAHPADPLWDLAMAAWHWVPLWTAERLAERLRLFVDAYGVHNWQEVLPVAIDLIRRMRTNHEGDTFGRALKALDRI